MNKLFQHMNKIEAEITAGLKDEVNSDGPEPAPDRAPSAAASTAAPAKSAASEPGSDDMGKLRQTLRKVEARLNEKVRVS